MRMFLGEGNGNPLQYSCLENPVDRGAWWAVVHRVSQSRTRLKKLSMHAYLGGGNGNPLQYSCLENPRDRGAWWAPVYGVTRSQTWLKQLSSSSSSMRTFLVLQPSISIKNIWIINFLFESSPKDSNQTGQRKLNRNFFSNSCILWFESSLRALYPRNNFVNKLSMYIRHSQYIKARLKQIIKYLFLFAYFCKHYLQMNW